VITSHAVDCSFVKGKISLASEDATEVHLHNTGYTAEVEVDGKAGHTEGGPFSDKHEFELIQFHFHAPSENTVNGKQFPLEVHFVHKSKTHGGLGVLGVFFEVGHANDELDFLLDVPDKVGSVELEEASPLRVLKHHSVGSFYTFRGSLTTPPCSEGVQWALSSKIATISKEQLWAFTDRFGENARPVQPVNHRKICFVDNGHSDFESEAGSSSSSSSAGDSSSSSSSSF
jgi:carbonic anhydrase